jgi:serine/threonine protein phosphatase PrpC
VLPIPFGARAEGPTCIDTANRRLFEAMYAAGGRPGMGTTVVGAVLLDQDALVFNVGDSRAYAMLEEGLFKLSRV